VIPVVMMRPLHRRCLVLEVLLQVGVIPLRRRQVAGL
jgi:hypothetical protein